MQATLKKIRNQKSEIRNKLKIRNQKSEKGDGAVDEVSDIRASNFPQGRPYFVMELVRGVPITEFCDEGNLSTRERLTLLAPGCQAAPHAPQQRSHHPDITPGPVPPAAALPT